MRKIAWLAMIGGQYGWMVLGTVDCEMGFGKDQTQESSFGARASESGHG